MNGWYENLKITLAVFALGVTTSMIIACGKDNSNNPPLVNNNPNAIYGCTNGTYYNGGYCHNPNGQQVGVYNGINFVTDNYYYRNFSIKDGTAYKNFLKTAMGVCDRTQSTGGIYDCSSWVSGYIQIVFQAQTAQTNNVQISFSAYPYSNQNYYYGYQLPSMSEFFLGIIGFPVFDSAGAVRNPLALNMTVSVINQNKGFEARGYGDLYTLGNRSLIQVVIPNGKIEDQQFDYELAFEGVVFATGRFTRY